MQGRWERAALGVVAAGVLSLVSNRVGWLIPALWVAAAALVALHTVRHRGGFDQRLMLRTGAVWAVWIVSYALTGESWRTFASFEFQRRDGQIFFSLLPLLVTAAAAPSARQTGAILGVFLALQGGVALAATGFDLLGRRESLTGSVFLFDEGPPSSNYCGFYLAHNAVGSVQALSCIVAATLAVFDPVPRRRGLWGFLAVPLLWGVILSKSRGSFLAMGITLAALGSMAIRQGRLNRRGVAALVAVIAITGLVLGPRLAHRLGQLGESGGTHGWRMEVWTRALTEWTLSPLVGEGMGRFNDEEREWSGVKHLYYVVTKAKVQNNAGHAHNSYVHFLAEGGIVGFGVTVGFWAWIAWKMRRSCEPLRIAAFLGVLYLFAISMTEHYMGGGAMLLVLSSLVGAAWNLPEPADRDRIAPT